MSNVEKGTLIHNVGLAVRQLGAQSVLASAVMAKHFQLHPTDLEVLDLIFVRKSVSAGDIIKATGLTSGSITALLDRLEKRQLIVRERDPNDGRRTCVCLNRTVSAPIEAAYLPRQRAMSALWSTYDDAALEIVIDFLTRSTALLVECTQQVGQDVAGPAPGSGSEAKPRRRRAATRD